MECEIGDAFERKGAGRNGAGWIRTQGRDAVKRVGGVGRRRFARSNANGVGASSLWQFPAILFVDHFRLAADPLARCPKAPSDFSALRTHKLKGKLAKSWAFSAGYNLRIVFQFVRHGAQEAILLEAVGTHDEVYESSQPHLEFPVRECTRGWRQGPREQSGRRKDARQRGAISRERRERTAEGRQGTRSPPDPKPQSQTPSDLL